MVGAEAAGERRAVAGTDSDDGCNRLGHDLSSAVVIA